MQASKPQTRRRARRISKAVPPCQVPSAMTDNYTVIILLTLVGFFALAFLLLAPVYLFLKREQKLGEQWTREIRKRRMREHPSPTNGAPHDAEEKHNEDA